MKKFCLAVLLIALIVSLSACGNTTNITMQEIYEASFSDALLENHESVYVRYMMDGEVYGENYLSKDYTYDASFGWSSFMTDHTYYSCMDDIYQRDLLLSPEGLADVASYRAENFESFILGPETAQETIQSVTKENNRITVTSFMDQEAIKALWSEEMGLISFNCEYVLDAKTHELISVKSVCGYNDGTKEEIIGNNLNATIPCRTVGLTVYHNELTI